MRPSRALRAAYTIQSLRTAAPLLAVDLVVTAVGMTVASCLVSYSFGYSVPLGLWRQLPALLVLQPLMMAMHQLYPGAGFGPVAELRGVTRSTCAALLCLSIVNFTVARLATVEAVIFALTAVMLSVALPTSRWIARRILGGTSWWGMRVLLIGKRADCVATQNQLASRRSSGLIPAGFACEDRDRSRVPRRASSPNPPSRTGRLAQKYSAPIAAIVSDDDGSASRERIMFQFPSVVWIDVAKAERDRLDVSRLPEICTTRMDMPFLRFAPRAFKRGLDLTLCVPGLLILAIPMAVVALAIKWASPGPVIYGSRRIGQHGREFRMWKFRTMVTQADRVLQERLESDPEAKAQWDRDSKLKVDPRIIPGIGQMLRRWSLDELPQLWNVLVGEMSLVGPRPVPPHEIVRYQRHYYEYTQMWPGMTGLWQVSGRNDTSFETRVFLVRHYARHWSPWLDFWVLLQTPKVVISKDGAY